MWGEVIGAGIGLLGNLFNSSANRDAQAQANQMNMMLNRENQALTREQMAQQERQFGINLAQQREFAQSGVRWRVEDARQAGLHPLAALGAQVSSFSPVSVGSVGTPSNIAMGAEKSDMDFSSFGQNIGRAIDSGSSTVERQDRLLAAIGKTGALMDLETKRLNNELIKSEVAKNYAQTAPPFPGGVVPMPQSGPERSQSGEAIKPKDIERETDAVDPHKTRWWYGIPLDSAGLINNSSGGQFEEGYGELGGSAMGVTNLPAHIINGLYNRAPSVDWGLRRIRGRFRSPRTGGSF